jgi:hypothetical protein
MRTVNILLVLVLMLGISSLSCTKRKEKGGKGGAAILKVTPQHHSKDIEECTIYLKYDASTPPSDNTAGYDEVVVCVQEAGKPVATFTGLKNGKYYIFGSGYDPDVAQNVKGGIPYEITQQSTLNINVPVTEGD